MTIDGVKILISAETKELDKKIQETTTKIGNWSAAGVAAAAAFGAAMVKAGLDSADSQAKLAQSLRTTTESLSVMKRAGDLSGVSMDGVAQATKDLQRRLSQAATAGGPVADALTKIHLSASELMALPLDQRISTINTALNKYTTESEKAAVAGQLFGEEGSLAMLRISPETIKQASEEVNRFGVALDSIDAKMIENANDTLSQISLAFNGLSQQMAADFAPILQAVTNELMASVDELGGMGKVSEKVFTYVMKGAGFVGDAFRGWQLIFKSLELALYGLRFVTAKVMEGISGFIDDTINDAKSNINVLIDGMNNLPGVNIDKLIVGKSAATEFFENFATQAAADIKTVKDDLINLSKEPLPSQTLEKWSSNVVETARRTAEEAVKVQSEIMSQPIEQASKPIDTQKLSDSLSAVVQSLQTENEQIDQMYLERANIIDQAYANGLLSQTAYHEQSTRNEEDYNKKMKTIDEASFNTKMQLLSSAFGNIATLMQTENKGLFEVGKVAAIAQATVDGISATISSYKAGAAIGGPIIGATFAATAALATGVQISKIAATNYGGGGNVSAPPAGTTGSGQQSIAQSANQQAQNLGSGTLTVQGLDSGALFTGDVVAGLAERIYDYSRSGGNVIFQR